MTRSGTWASSKNERRGSASLCSGCDERRRHAVRGSHRSRGAKSGDAHVVHVKVRVSEGDDSAWRRFDERATDDRSSCARCGMMCEARMSSGRLAREVGGETAAAIVMVGEGVEV